jgi:hypothetical protein
VLHARRQRRVVGVDVHVEDVHDRRGAAARPVGGAEIADEGRRRVRRLRAVAVVGAARCERAPDDDSVRPRLLDRVVARRQQQLVGHGRRVGAVEAELRHPEHVRVGLVADDEARDRRQPTRGCGGELDDLRPRRVVRRRRTRAQVVERHHRLDPRHPGRVGGGARVRELAGVGRRLAGRPLERHAHGVEPSQAREIHLGHRIAPLGRVFRGSDPHRRPSRERRRPRGECRRCDQYRDQTPVHLDPFRPVRGRQGSAGS